MTSQVRNQTRLGRPEAARDRENFGGVDAPKLLAAGGILAAVGAASCCVIPFALFLLGVSGAWIGNLTALEPYQPVFAAISVGFIGYGAYLVYWEPKARVWTVPPARGRARAAWPRSASGAQKHSSSLPVASVMYLDCSSVPSPGRRP